MANSILRQGLPGMPGSVPQQPQLPVSNQWQAPMQMPQVQPPAMSQPATQGEMPMMNMINQIRRFGSMIQGNPQQMVMGMLQSGQRTQADLQQAMQMARQITGTGMFK